MKTVPPEYQPKNVPEGLEGLFDTRWGIGELPDGLINTFPLSELAARIKARDEAELRDYDPNQPRDPRGRWSSGGDEYLEAIKGVNPGFEPSEDIPHYVGLSHGERNIINSYTQSNGSIPLNKALRNDSLTGEQLQYVKKLNLALSHVPDYAGVTNRVGSNNPDVLKAYQGAVGKVIEERGFMSTGRSGGTYADERRLVNFTVNGKTGKDIARIAAEPGEREVLFMSGTRFKVGSVKQGEDGKFDVMLQEV